MRAGVRRSVPAGIPSRGPSPSPERAGGDRAGVFVDRVRTAVRPAGAARRRGGVAVGLRGRRCRHRSPGRRPRGIGARSGGEPPPVAAPTPRSLSPPQTTKTTRRDDQVDDQAGAEQRDLVARQVLPVHDAVDDRAVDADRARSRRACAPCTTIAPISSGLIRYLRREAQRDRRDDGDRGRADRADRRQRAGDRRTSPTGSATTRPRTSRIEACTSQSVVPLARAMANRYVTPTSTTNRSPGKPAKIFVGVEVRRRAAHAERGGEGEGAHVDRAGRGDDEHHHQHEDRYQFGGHTGSRPWVPEGCRVEGRLLMSWPDKWPNGQVAGPHAVPRSCCGVKGLDEIGSATRPPGQ